MEKEANHPLLSPSSVLPKPTRQHLCKCAHHPQWTAQEKKQRCCWACQALLDPLNQRKRKKACANPWPWAKDSLGLGLTTYKGYKLNVNAKANEKKQKKKKEKDEGEASPSRGGQDEQQNPATTHQPCNDVVPRPHDDHPWSVGRLDQLADKVARYLQSVTTTTTVDGDHEGGRVGPIDDLLDRVKSAYLRLVACPPGDIRAIAASTDEPDLLLPLVPDSPEGDGNAEEEFIAAHVATAGPGHEDGILPPPDPRCSSPEPTPSDHRSDKRVDADAPSAEGAGRESWMEEWAQKDIEDLLAGDPDDDGDFTDRHWKRGAEEPEADQPTASGSGNQDSYDERDQGEDIRAGEEVHRDSSHEPQSQNQRTSQEAPGWSAVSNSHAQERRQMERPPWARDQDNERRGWERSSYKRSHHDRPFQPRDTHHRSEAKNHHSRHHAHHAPPQNWRLKHNYSHQQRRHNRHTETPPNATHGRKRSRERTDHFARSSDARQAYHHHPGAGRDKRTRREDKPE